MVNPLEAVLMIWVVERPIFVPLSLSLYSPFGYADMNVSRACCIDARKPKVLLLCSCFSRGLYNEKAAFIFLSETLGMVME